ncbi:MAG TPA: PAS domain S-box protein [Steroidobacteraceae bacterium]
MTKRSTQAVSEAIRRWLGNDQPRTPPPAEQLFERFMRHLPGMAWLKDASGKFVYVNDAMARWLGVPPQALLGKTIPEVFGPDAVQQCIDSDTAAMASEAGVQVIEKFRFGDGTVHSALVSKFRVDGPEDMPALLGGIAIDITDRMQAEERWRRSEEHLRLATRTGKVGAWDWDIETNRFTWTGSLYAIHGVTPEEFDGTMEGFVKLIHPDDRSMATTAIYRSLESGQACDFEFRAIRPDGTVIWVYTNAEVIYENGRAVRMVGATLDITTRKQTELALRESEQRFAKAFNASPLVLTLSSISTGKLIEVNDTFCRLTGYSREEAIGRSTVELGLWSNVDDRRAVSEQLRREGRVRDREFRFRSRDGREVICLFSAERIDIHGEPHSLAVLQDITDRANAQRALRVSEERLRLALRGANAGVWVYHADTRAAFWSTEFRSLFGFGPEVPCSLDILMSRVHPDDRERVRTEFVTLLRSGEGEFRQEFRVLHPQLGLRWMLTLGRIEREDGAVHCHGISLDISRLKQVEDELRSEDQRKNEFLATLAHELRNPLAPIRNGLEILKRTSGDSDMAQQARAMMERQLRQMVRLIDDLLDLSRISRGKIELERERVDLTSVVQNALEVSRPLIEQAGHRLTLELASDALFVHADTTRLAQVFANLLNNAAKYTNNGGHIRMTMSRAGNEAVVSVRDDGIGIPAEMLTRVFDMFTQVDRSLEKAQGGLGIGLSIAKQLVEMHGGSIEAHSDGPGKGSEFTVRLPLCPAIASSTMRESHGLSMQVTGIRILVADDNLDAACSLAMMLSIDGNEVRTASDGLEAVEVAKAFRPQVALLDIGMPRLNGYEVCKQLRKIADLADCLIIATTGWGQDDDMQRSREAGFDHHLVKPIEMRALEELLAREIPRLRSGRAMH